MDTVLRTAAISPPRLIRSTPPGLALPVNAIALCLAVAAIFVVHPNNASIKLGGVAGETLVAQSRVTYLDRVATAAKRRHAMATVSPAYRNNTATATLRRRQAAAFLSRAAAVLTGQYRPVHRLRFIRRLLPPGISATPLQQLPALTSDDLAIVQQRSLGLLAQAESWRYPASELSTTEISLLSTLSADTTAVERTAIGDVLAAFLYPTLIRDPQATQIKRQHAAARIKPVMSTIYPGQVIVRRGDLVTPAVMEQLKALGLQTRHSNWKEILASLLFAVVVIAILFWYLYAFQSAILTNARLLLLIDGMVLATLGVAKLFSAGHVLLPFFLPVAAVSTFAAVLIAPEAAIVITLVMAVLAGWVVANSFELTAYYFLTGAAGILAIRQVRQLKQFVLAGLYITSVALLTVVAFGLLDNSYDLAALEEHTLAAVFNGAISATLALGGFVLLADFFGITTSLRLLELAQPDQPLLRRLMVRAPGTYNHSLIVGNMVERAADDIGANALVAKVGALYHDVGKVSNPHCFVENQLGDANIHDELRPDESARIIRGHVSQGMRLAHQQKLPRVILDTIAEHHGTMTIGYFLQQAREAGEGSVDDSVYSHGGPKPQTKETALVMLADACESAVRASPDHSQTRIADVVEKIFHERVEQGQLDESPLTLEDLERSREAFRAVLNGLYHPRIEYPDPSDLTLQSTPAQ